MLITDLEFCGDRINKLGLGVDGGQEVLQMDAGSGKGGLEFRPTDYRLKFPKGSRTHNWNDTALQESLNDPRRRSHGGQQAGHQHIGVKNDAHACVAPPRLRRRFDRV